MLNTPTLTLTYTHTILVFILLDGGYRLHGCRSRRSHVDFRRHLKVDIVLQHPPPPIIIHRRNSLCRVTGFYKSEPILFSEEYPLFSEQGLRLAERMLEVNRWKRISAQEAPRTQILF